MRKSKKTKVKQIKELHKLECEIRKFRGPRKDLWLLKLSNNQG